MECTGTCRERAISTISSPQNTIIWKGKIMKYISNIDTIYLLLDTEDYEKNNEQLLDYLKEEKEKAKMIILNNTSYKHMININNMNFEILNVGTKGYAYILRNCGYQICIAQYRSNLANFMPIKIRISSEYLWAYGLEASWNMIHNWIIEVFGNIVSQKICRLDLCTHISGVELLENYEKSYKGNFKKREIFYNGKNINAITFGRRQSDIFCRIYNKSLEVQEKKQKMWFYEIWKKNNMDIKNVWNIEFELKSGILRKLSIITVQDLLEHLQDIWKFCTCKWLEKIDRTNIRVERCTVNRDWIEIQKAYDHFKSKGIIEKKKQIELDALVLVPNIVGSITSYSARKGKSNIEDAFADLYKDAKKYLINKETSFEKEVNKKRQILGK